MKRVLGCKETGKHGFKEESPVNIALAPQNSREMASSKKRSGRRAEKRYRGKESKRKGG